MDPPPSARAATQAVEARPQGLRGNAPTRTVTVGGRSGRLPRTTLVASRRQASSGRPYHPLLRPTGSAQTCRLTSTFRTAGCGPACPVVWQGSSGAPLPPMPIIAGLQANSILWIAVLVIAGAALSWPALSRIVPAGTLLFRSGLPAALAMRGLLMFAYCEALAFFPLALEMVRGLSPTTAGVALSIGSIGWTSGSWTQAACDYRFGPGARPRIMLFGLLVLAIGIGGAAGTVVTRYPLGVAIVAWGLAGLGMGICYNTSTVLSIQAETGHSAGTVSSSMQLTDSLGQTLGAGFGGAAMTSRRGRHGAHQPASVRRSHFRCGL